MTEPSPPTPPTNGAPSLHPGPSPTVATFLRGIDVAALRRLVVFGFGLRLLLWALSSGSGDIRGWARIGAEVAAHGVRRLYAGGPFVRHSPVSALWAGTAHRISTSLEAPFEMVFKVAPLIADAGVLALIIATVQRRGGRSIDAWRAAALYATSLAVVWVTGHHGGLETVLVCAALAAVIFVDEGDRPVLAGLALAGAIHVHMVAIVLLPALWLLQARSLRLALRFSLALLVGLAPLALPLSARGLRFIERSLNIAAPSNRWGLQFLWSEGGEIGILGHAVELIGARVQEESFKLALLASLAIGLWARLRARSGIEAGALVIGAFLVLTPSIGLQYAALPMAFLVVVDLRRALLYSLVSGVALTLAYLGFARAEMPLVTVHSRPIGFVAGCFSFGAWLILVGLLVRRLRPEAVRTGGDAWRLVREQARLPLVFVGLAAPVGLGLALATPPFQVADEPLHAFTACAIAHGQLVPGQDAPAPWTTTLDVPADLVAFNRAVAALKLPHKPGTRASVPALLDAARLPHDPTLQHISTREETREIGVYPPAMYAPQALACAAGRAAALRPWSLLSAMRLANLAAYILLGALALWWLPTGREAATLLLLSPMALSSGASVSADGQLIPLVALWLALLLHAAARRPERPLSLPLLGGAIVFAGALSLAKSVYLPLALAFVLLPGGCFATRAQRGVATILVLASAVVGAVIWIPQAGDGLEAWALKLGLDPATTLDLRLESPFTFALTALRTFFRERILTGVVGTLGWRDTVLPFSAVATFWVTWIGVTLVGGSTSSSWRRGLGLVVLGLGAAGALLLFYALYFTKPDARWVSDVQGRHFLPALIFIAVGTAEYLGIAVGLRGRRLLAVVVAVVGAWVLVKALGAVEARYYRDRVAVPAIVQATFSRPPEVRLPDATPSSADETAADETATDETTADETTADKETADRPPTASDAEDAVGDATP